MEFCSAAVDTDSKNTLHCNKEAIEGKRDKLVKDHLPLLISIAARVKAKLPETVELDELVAMGVFGLMDAAKRYDPQRRTKFTSFSTPRIRGAIFDGLRQADFVPRQVRTRQRKLNEASLRLQAVLGRTPTDAELADELGIAQNRATKYLHEARPLRVISLEKSCTDTDEGFGLRESQAITDYREPTPSSQRKDFLREVCRGLDRSERLIIILYYYEQLTMKEIGNTLGLSESRVSQLHSQILAQIRLRKGSLRQNVA